MFKMLATCAVLATATAFALPQPAGAKEIRPDGLRNSDQVEVSDQRRRHRHYQRHGYHRHSYRRYHGPRYWGPPPAYYGPGPYAYAPYYYRPAPFVGIGVGPFRFGFW